MNPTALPSGPAEATSLMVVDLSCENPSHHIHSANNFPPPHPVPWRLLQQSRHMKGMGKSDTVFLAPSRLLGMLDDFKGELGVCKHLLNTRFTRNCRISNPNNFKLFKLILGWGRELYLGLPS